LDAVGTAAWANLSASLGHPYTWQSADAFGQKDLEPSPSQGLMGKDTAVLEEVVKRLTEANERIDKLGVRL
jgi:hypothetical protein